MTEQAAFAPDWVSPPGETIADILAERDLSTSEFAERLGCRVEFAEALLRGTTKITPTIASQLEQVLGARAGFWLAREDQYQQDMTRRRESINTTACKEWLTRIPVKDMLTLGWVEAGLDVRDTAARCLQFFGVSTVDEWNHLYGDIVDETRFRTSSTFESEPGAVAAWIRQGELEAASLACRPWNPSALRAQLSSLRALTKEKEPAVFVRALRDQCAALGVAFVVARAPKGCRASGAVRALPRGRRLLLLSFRHMSDDHFWFSFFHEIGHLLLHGDRPFILDGDGATWRKEEDEADDFAQNTLIPPDQQPAMLLLPPNHRAIIRFANQIGVSPGIVVGQLQHANRLKHDQMNRLKRRYVWNDSAIPERA